MLQKMNSQRYDLGRIITVNVNKFIYEHVEANEMK